MGGIPAREGELECLILAQCMDRLLFASGYALDSGSRSYVSGLFDRLVGRGLDGAYTADNIRIVCWAANMLLGTWGDKPAMKVATGIARRGGR